MGESQVRADSNPVVPPATVDASQQEERPGKRERILAAAARLFAANEYHRVLMDEIAERSGVGKGTLYRYFETKEDLFVAVLGYALDQTSERLRAGIEATADPVERLRAACVQALRFFRENDGLFHVLNHERALRCARGSQELEAKRKALRLFAEAMLREGRDRGVFSVDDPAFASTMLWGMVRAALRSAPPEEPLEPIAARIVELFTRGVLARREGEPPQKG